MHDQVTSLMSTMAGEEADAEAATRVARDLLRRAQRGDMHAFGQLVQQYEARALTTAHRLLGNREDALDATQDALVRLYRFINRVDDSRDFGAWVYRVVVNAAMDLMQRRSRQWQMVQRYQVENRGQDLEDRSAEQDLDSRRASAALADVLQRLPDRERTALVLRDIEGLSTREVAQAMGCSEATVRSQICSARAKLRVLRQAPETELSQDDPEETR